MITNSILNGKPYKVKIYPINRTKCLKAFKKFKYLVTFDHDLVLTTSYEGFREYSNSYWLKFVFRCKNCKFRYENTINRFGRRRSYSDARKLMREILSFEIYGETDPRLGKCNQHDNISEIINVMDL